MNAWHSNRQECQNCVDVVPKDYDSDEDYILEKNTLLNPSGKTQPIFYDDREDSHGF